ncbi:MAG: DUF6544 family protein [Bacteroidota bacterium]
MKMKIILISSIFAIIILGLLAGKIYMSRQFHQEVAILFKGSKPVSSRPFSYGQLADLPEPVRRYFKLVLKDGQPYISCARIRHNGQFKSGPAKGWVNIKGEQYATTGQPGFIWKGTTNLFTARDMYINNKGRLVVSLFGIVKVVDGQGKSFDQGELLRWLGESVLYPTNLLPGPDRQWSAIDARHAKFTFNYNGLALFYTVTFNEAGEITELVTKRYMDEKHLETWLIKVGSYRNLNDVKVPTVFEVVWKLKKGDLSYARFNITTIEYGQAERF